MLNDGFAVRSMCCPVDMAFGAEDGTQGYEEEIGKCSYGMISHSQSFELSAVLDNC